MLQTSGTVSVSGVNGLTLYGANNGVNSYTVTGGVFNTMTAGRAIKLHSRVTESGSNTFAPTIGTTTGNMKKAKISSHGTILVYNNNAINGLGVTADGGTSIYTGVNDDGTANHNYYKSDGGWFAQKGGLLKLDWKANNNDLTRSGNKIAWGLWDQTNISASVTLSGTDNVHALLLTVKNGSAATDLDISFAAADIGTLGGVTLGDITNSDG
ncbi:MAG: hypothetical protein LBK60_08635, partial [Verrucomicrobiales bacterium]|nr:hypothetical protein [Verrucomicrobiales bacterium]